MSEIVGEPMDAERERELRSWLKKPEFKTLATVIGAKSRLLVERAVSEAFMGSGNKTNYELKSIDSMQRAERYQIALDVLSELATQTERYQIVKLKP